MKTIAFAGSNSSTSINHQLVTYASKNIQDVEVIKLTDYNIPMYSEDVEKNNGVPQGVKDLGSKLSEFDRMIISVSEHNGNISGFFKNIVDWSSRNNREFLKGKKVILLSTSPGPGGASSALQITAKTLPYFGAEVLKTLSVGSFYDVFKDGGIANEEIDKELQEVLKLIEQLGLGVYENFKNKFQCRKEVNRIISKFLEKHQDAQIIERDVAYSNLTLANQDFMRASFIKEIIAKLKKKF